MLQQKSSESTGAASNPVTINAAEALLSFSAASAVCGIVYHLKEEKLAREVAADSVQRTLDRLSAKPFAPTVARSRWTAMTNPQRLDWLLNETQTITLVGAQDVVMLRSRRTR